MRNRTLAKGIALLGVVLVLGSCAGQRRARDDSQDAQPSFDAVAAAKEWLAYSTGVNPGSSIQFVTPLVGWRVDGQSGVPHLDDQVAAGPHGTSFAWPGTGVSITNDGGASWTEIAADEFGVWGFDLLTEETGWVVGVTRLSRTDDGGATWEELGEPEDTHLVTVAFASDTDGVGLTTEGSLVRTTDGGVTWSQETSINGDGVALCVDDKGTTFVSDASGSVFLSPAETTEWRLSQRSPIQGDAASTSQPFWSTLTCGDDSVWQVINVLDMQSHAGLPYVVSSTADGGSTWRFVAAYSNDSAVVVPKAAAPFPSALVAGGTSASGYIVGLPNSGFGLDVARAANKVTPASVPPIRSTISPNQPVGYIQVWGVSSVGSTAWILFNNAALGTPADPADQLTVLASNDGGQSWKVASEGPIEPEPPLSYHAPPPPSPA
jgi:hypothetical protein